MTTKAPLTRRFAQALLLAGGLALAAGPVQAQPAQGGGQKGAAPSLSEQDKQELKQAQKKIQRLRKKINKLQKKVLSNSQDLQSQREELKSLVKEKMRGQGAKPDEDIARMKELRKKLQNNQKDMAKSERRKIMQEFRETAQTFKKAQSQAMKDPEVQKARDAFKSDLKEAMQKANPQAEQMLKDLQEAQKAFRDKLSSSMGGGQGKGGGNR
jgi:chromosome segregation ATPase